MHIAICPRSIPHSILIIWDALCSALFSCDTVLFNRFQDVVWDWRWCGNVITECTVSIGIGLIAQWNWDALRWDPLCCTAAGVTTCAILIGSNAVRRIESVIIWAILSQILEKIEKLPSEFVFNCRCTLPCVTASVHFDIRWYERVSRRVVVQ